MSYGEDLQIPWIFIATAEGDEEKSLFDELMDTGPSTHGSRHSEMDPTSDDFPGLQMRPLDEMSTLSSVMDSGVAGSRDVIKETDHSPSPHRTFVRSRLESSSTADAGFLENHNGLNNLLMIPPSGPFVTLTPRPMRRAISAKALGDLGSHYSLYGAQSPSRLKRIHGNSLGPDSPSSFFADSISAINVPVNVNNEMSKQEKSQLLKKNLSQLLSGVYAVFLLMLGGILYISDQHGDKRILTEIFSSVIAGVGILWLISLHVDLCSYKREVLKQLKEREDAMQEHADRISNATEYIINAGYAYAATAPIANRTSAVPPYRFLIGRHSGSFYLKIGMAAFCFGNLIYEGLQLGQHILNFIDDEKKQLNCSRPSSVLLHIILPMHAFYQLFITFKYSNIIINRHKATARFGLMHLIATCLCFWFSTIVEEAVEDYNHKSSNTTANSTDMEFDIASFHIVVQKKGEWNNPYHCTADSVLSIRSMKAIPYLYPFAIEYNLLLAGVWYVVWQNIGHNDSHSNPHHLRHTISQDEGGSEEIAYQSNLVISADCHASNKGLFVGLFLLLTTIVTVIVFFVAMSTDGYQERAVSIHTGQEGVLTLIGMLSVIGSFLQIRQLDVNAHPITFLDDVLLFVPLPFYFVHGLMSVMAEYNNKSYTRLAVHILVTLQVIVQTPFIIDGLRRCSNSQELRYKKPGREVVTFLIILNLILWIVNTFELKSVERFHAQEEYFGDLIWMFIGHTTLPLMLFYRFHSSVCLADMWKSAYEKEM